MLRVQVGAGGRGRRGHPVVEAGAGLRELEEQKKKEGEELGAGVCNGGQGWWWAALVWHAGLKPWK